MVKQALHFFTAVFGSFEDDDVGMFEEWEKEVEQALHLLTGGSMATEWKNVVKQALHFFTGVSGRFEDNGVGMFEEWKKEVEQALHFLTEGSMATEWKNVVKQALHFFTGFSGSFETTTIAYSRRGSKRSIRPSTSSRWLMATEWKEVVLQALHFFTGAAAFLRTMAFLRSGSKRSSGPPQPLRGVQQEAEQAFHIPQELAACRSCPDHRLPRGGLCDLGGPCGLWWPVRRPVSCLGGVGHGTWTGHRLVVIDIQGVDMGKKKERWVEEERAERG